jgi:hypothetical protein
MQRFSPKGAQIPKLHVMRYCIPLLALFLYACQPADMRENNFDVMGYSPVYANAQTVNTIAVEPAKATTHPGKIYAYSTYLFQVEENEGIHIIDNAIPKQAHKIAFLKIPLCTELAIKSNKLYTNNLNDLVVFDLANVAAPQLVNRVQDAFPAIDQSYPPFTNTYFECADPSKGIVIGWERKMIHQPKCRR